MSYSLFITFTCFISFDPDHKPVSSEGRSCLPRFIDGDMRFLEVQLFVHSFQDFCAALLTQHQPHPMTPAAYEIEYFCLRPEIVSFLLFIPSMMPILFSAEGTQNFSWETMSIFCTWIWLTCRTSKYFYVHFLNWGSQLSQKTIIRDLLSPMEQIRKQAQRNCSHNHSGPG